MEQIKENKVLIVIVHYSSLEITDKAISSIRDGSLVPDISVVCNGLEAAYFEKKGVISIIEDENRGYASRLNKAIDYALKNGYHYVIFANNDIIVERDTISKMYLFIEKNPNIIVGPILVNEDYVIQSAGIRFNLLTGRVYNLYYGKELSSLRNKIILPDAVAGTFLMVNTNLLKSLRFDEQYDFYFEDVSFCISAQGFGIRPVVLTDAIVIHRGSVTIGNLPFKRIVEMVTKNHLLTVCRHSMLKSNLLRFVPCWLAIMYNLLYFGFRIRRPIEAIKGVSSAILFLLKERRI